MTTLLLRGGRLWDGGEYDILVRGGLIERIDKDIREPGTEVHEVGGMLVLPGLVDAHAHLDKTLFGGAWIPHPARDDLADRIATERARRHDLGVPRRENMLALLEQMIDSGTTHLRTHTDVDPEVGLSRVQAVDEVVAAVAGRISVTQVAFPQYGILTQPGTAVLLEQAVRQGVRGIGGIDPAGMDGDPVRHLDVVFGLAGRYGCDVDIHLHDGGSLGAWELGLIAERTQALGLQGKVTVSHAYALGQIETAELDRVIGKLASAGVGITTAAVYSFPVAPLKKLVAAGVNVACGNDGIRDLWGPYGSGDMLERAMHLAYRSMFRRDDDIELALAAATYGGAKALGIKDYGLKEGCVADLVVLPASCAAEAVVAHPPRALVLKEGRPTRR